MSLSYIIPLANIGHPDFFDRVNNVQRQLNEYPEDIQIIIVEQRIMDVIPTFFRQLSIPKNATYYRLEYPVFNKSWCINLGVKKSKYGNIIIGESDCTPEHSHKYFTDLLNYVDKNNTKWMFGWDRIKYYNKDHSDVYRDDEPKKGMAEGGLQYFNKDFFWSIGGSNEFLQELGTIDNELVRRAELNGGYHKFNHTIIHHWHEWNKMKKDNWKFAEHRNDNKKIYYWVDKHKKESIEFLNKYKSGDITLPLIGKYDNAFLQHINNKKRK